MTQDRGPWSGHLSVDPAVRPTASEADNEPVLPKGAPLGRYVVLEPLGRGAMGVVYRAFDPELDRRVAVKLLLRSRAPSEGPEQERLQREGRAMARLSHPNVVAVYDVGTHDGRVFVAMELVEGGTLRRWLTAERSLRAIVSMFLQAGRGLAAAHAAGVVHRDFKPDNALVGTDGRVRVVDFGLARAPEPGGDGEATAPDGVPVYSSSYGSAGILNSLAGTPHYSSPEQMEGRGVDARADQFAFCATLWEALHGAPPFAGSDLFTLFNNKRDGKLLAAPGSRRVPGRIADTLRRGLSADPGDRFPSMNALLDALDHDPWVAWRWRAGVAAALAVVVAGGGLALRERAQERVRLCDGGEEKFSGVWDASRRAAVEGALLASGKPWARDTSSLVGREIERYGRAWVAMYRDACEATSVRREQSEALLDLRMQCLGARLQETRALAALLSQPADGLLESAPKAVYALAPLEGCADTKALLAPVPPPADRATREEVDRVRVELSRARALVDLGRYQEAEPLARGLAGRGHDAQYPPVEAAALEVAGDALEAESEYARAVEAYRGALLASERGLDRARQASVLINLVWAVGADQGSYDRGREYADEGHAVLAGLGRDLVLEANLASYEASVLFDQGHATEAQALGREAVEKRRAAFGDQHPRYAMALTNEAFFLAARGHDAEALELAQASLAIQARALGEHHPDYGLSLMNVAASLNLVGRHEEARVLGEEALGVLTEALGHEHTRVAAALNSLGLTELAMGAYADAERHQRDAIEVAVRLRGADHPYVGAYTCCLADVLAKAGRPAEALPLYERTLEIEGKSGDPAEGAWARWGLGHVLLALGRPRDALPALEDAVAWYEKNDPTSKGVDRMHFDLARALRATGGDAARARELALTAARGFGRDAEQADDAREVAAWLDGGGGTGR